MNWFSRTTTVFSRLHETARSHPLVTLSSLLLATFLAVLVEIPSRDAPIWVDKITMSGIFWLIATLVAALLRLALSFNQERETSFGLAGAGLSLFVAVLLPDFRGQHNQLTFILCCLPLLSIPGIALFRLNESIDAPRTFILKLLSAIFISGLLSFAAWVLGVIAIVGVDALLFKLNGKSDHITVISLYAFVVAMPLLLLLYLRTTETLHAVWERLFEALSRYILLPAIVLYEVILAAYSLKIVVTGEMPKGTVAVLVSFCAILAIIVFTLLPSSCTNGWRRVKRGLFICLAPFLGFLWYAVLERLLAYGFTAERYLLLVSALCLTATTLWTIIFNRSVLSFFSATIALGALVALAGPIGFESVSKQSQWNRLVATLESTNLLADGKWKPHASSIPFKTRKEITSALTWFSDHNLHEKVSPVLDKESDAIWTKPVPCLSTARRCYKRGDSNAEKLLTHLGIKAVQPWETNTSSTEAFSERRLPYDKIISTENRIFAGEIRCIYSNGYELFSAPEGASNRTSIATVRFSNNCRTLSVVAQGQTRCEIADLLAGVKETQNESIPDSALLHSASGTGCSIRFLARSISFAKDDSGNLIPKSANVDGMIWIEFK